MRVVENKILILDESEVKGNRDRWFYPFVFVETVTEEGTTLEMIKSRGSSFSANA